MSAASILKKSKLNGIHILGAKDLDFELDHFDIQFPYWRRMIRTLQSSEGMETVAFVPSGVAESGDELIACSERWGIDRWVAADCYDEFGSSLKALQMDGQTVDWVPPEWPEETSVADERAYILFLGEDSARASILQPFILEELSRAIGIEMRPLFVKGEADWRRCFDAIRGAKACLSFLGNPQVEHWLYKVALQAGVSGWVSVTNRRLSLRFCTDSNRNRVCWNTGVTARLGRFLAALRSLQFEGCLGRPDYSESWIENGSLVRCLNESGNIGWRVGLSLDAGGVDVGGRSAASFMNLTSDLLEGRAKSGLGVYLSPMGGSRSEEYFEVLENRAFGLEWSELFLYRFFRDPQFLESSVSQARRGQFTSRSLGKIASSLLEAARLAPNDGACEWHRRGYEIFEEVYAIGGASGDLMNRMGLAAVMTGHETRLEEFAEQFRRRSSGSRHFFLPIGERLVRAEKFDAGMRYLERELDAFGPDQPTLLVQLDGLCGMGKWEEALSAASELGDPGYSNIGTFLLRNRWLWDAERNSEEGMRCALTALDGFSLELPWVDRARALHRAQLGELSEAKRASDRFTASVTDAEFRSLQLTVDLGMLGNGVALPADWGMQAKLPRKDLSWRGLLLYAVAALQAGDGSMLAKLQSAEVDLDRVSVDYPHDCLFALREYLVILESLAGLKTETETRALGRRLVARMGQTQVSLPVRWTKKGGAAIEGGSSGLMRIVDRARSLLEPRFLDL